MLRQSQNMNQENGGISRSTLNICMEIKIQALRKSDLGLLPMQNGVLPRQTSGYIDEEIDRRERYKWIYS